VEKTPKRFARFVMSFSAPGKTLQERTQTSLLITNVMNVAGVHTVAIDVNEKLAVVDMDIKEGNFCEVLAVFLGHGYHCDSPHVSMAHSIRELRSEPTMKTPSAFCFRPRITKLFRE
jgi:hypothetical protein